MKSKFFILVLLLSMGSFTKAQINLDSGLVACYPFTGNAMDSSGNGNHGTVNGAVLAMDRFGNPNSAYSFDGINDFIEITNSVIPSKEISISFWSKANQFKSHWVFMLVPNNQSDRMSVVVNYSHNGDTAIFWDFGNLSGNGRLGDFPLPSFVSDWEHYVCIASQSKDSMIIYRDGVLQKGVNYSDIVNDTSRTLRIGSGDNIGYFNGLIDDIRIYNRALTIAEMQALYNGVSCSQITGIDQPEKTHTTIMVFPNPSNKIITLEFKNENREQHTLSIYNAKGQLVKEIDNITTGQIKINREDINNGIYFFHLKNEKEILGSGKIIIE